MTLPPKAARRRPWRKSILYPVVGALLGLGAPVGLIVLRRLLARELSLGAAMEDVQNDAITYAYLTLSTMLAFSGFGAFVGRVTDRLRASATTDPLTGLANRRMCEERVLLELKRVARYRSALSLLLVDVDRLKQINDEHGHDAGDAALKQVAEALSVSCRATDLAARWGGDEFAILAPGTSAEEAASLATRIREALRRITSGSPSGQTTVSIGITDLVRIGAPAPEGLYAAADAALYEAKAGGRDRAAVFSTNARPE